MVVITTGWRRLMGSPKLQIIFHKRATKYRSLLRKMTHKDKGSYESSPPCTYRYKMYAFTYTYIYTDGFIYVHTYIYIIWIYRCIYIYTCIGVRSKFGHKETCHYDL